MAVDQNFSPAQANLAVMYHYGDGVAQDKAEAIRLFRLAAEQGSGLAQYYLGKLYMLGDGVEKNSITAQMWFILASTDGDPQSMLLRDKLAGILTPAEASEAQARADRCAASDYGDCN